MNIIQILCEIISRNYLILLLLAAVVLTSQMLDKKSATRKRPNKSRDKEAKPSSTGKWYPTGWVYNEKTQKWDPPDYLLKESRAKWKWDESKQVWIDVEKEHRLKRYREYHKDKPPTFEQWKASREQGSTAIPNSEPRPESSSSNPKASEYQGAYKAASILTPKESIHFKTLKSAADRKGYTVSVKMRLADLVTPTASKYDKSYMSYFGKIKSKHVDFVVFDQSMCPKVIIELDDSSHDRKDRIERDYFVDSILTDAGYKVIHTRHILPDILDNI